MGVQLVTGLFLLFVKIVMEDDVVLFHVIDKNLELDIYNKELCDMTNLLQPGLVGNSEIVQ